MLADADADADVDVDVDADADAVLCSEVMMVVRGVSDDDLNECRWAEDSRQSLWSSAIRGG